MNLLKFLGIRLHFNLSPRNYKNQLQMVAVDWAGKDLSGADLSTRDFAGAH